jgi:MoxR-like ATPase
VVAKHRPIVIITSNAEKELPDAFLRRCVFHFIDFPEKSLMKDIVRVHHPKIEESLVDQAIETFFEIRSMTGCASARAPASWWTGSPCSSAPA